MKQALLKITSAWVSICLSFSSCVLQEKESKVEVVERSKETRPEWVATVSQVPIVQEDKYRFVTLVSPILSIQDEIKDIEKLAKENSERLVVGLVHENLNYVVINQDINLENKEILNAVVAKVTKKELSSLSKIEDIYFEKIRNQNNEKNYREYYDVYILTGFVQNNLGKIYGDLANSLRATGEKDLLKLAAALSRQSPAGLSH